MLSNFDPLYLHRELQFRAKRVTSPNIPQLKLGNIREYSPILKNARFAKKIWRIIKTIAYIWCENVLGNLSLDIICSSQIIVFLELRSRKTVRMLLGTDNVRGQISEHIFAPNGDYCLYIARIDSSRPWKFSTETVLRLYYKGLLSAFFSNFIFGFHGFRLKIWKIIQLKSNWVLN